MPLPQIVISPGLFPASTSGPDACDFGPSRDQPGGFFEVSIVPIDNGAGGPVTRDALGQLLHCLIRFPLIQGNHIRGARWAKGWSDGGDGSFQIEADASTYYFTQGTSVAFTGGTKGDRYQVEVIEAGHIPTPREVALYRSSGGETPIRFEYELTSVFPAGGAFAPVVTIPLMHTYAVAVAGVITYDGVPLVPSVQRLPTTAASITAAAGSIVKTGGWF